MAQINVSNMVADPWYKSTFQTTLLGARLNFHVPHDVFATTNIDEGTLLLLEHLPATEPKSVLDMGCGYGALGLPIAARYPQATVELVDRDLLPVAWAMKNAGQNNISNVNVHGSLGYRNTTPRPNEGYDWILCNVPARIGRPFIEHLLKAGRALLLPKGEVRIVVIRDLAPVIEELAAEHHWPITEAGRGPRHVVFALGSDSSEKPVALKEPTELYARDVVQIEGSKFERPYDLRGDDPRLLAQGLPVLLDALPRQAPRRALCFRASYGALPLICRKRWPEAEITAVDRDLLMTDFISRNARQLGLDGAKLTIRESAHFPDMLGPNQRYDLAVGELLAATGQKVANAELEALAASLDRGGQALVLTLDRLERDWIRPFAEGKRRLSIARVVAREGYAVVRLANI